MQPISYKRHRFPPELIQHAVWLYFRFTLSLRDVEDLLAERGVEVSYETIRCWTRKFGRHYARNLRRLSLAARIRAYPARTFNRGLRAGDRGDVAVGVMGSRH